MGKTDNSHVLHGNDIGGSGSGTTALSSTRNNGDELRVGVRNDDTSEKSTSDEENSETPVNSLERSLDVGTGTLGLSRHHRDILWADDTERG